MGCSKCKKKKQDNQSNSQNVDFNEVNPNEVKTGVKYNKGNLNIGLGPDIMDGLAELQPQNFVLRVIVFLALLVVIPLLVVYLLFIFVKAMFMPDIKTIPASFDKLIKFVTYPFTKAKEIRQKAKLKAREKEFGEKRGYEDGSELLNVEVFESKDLKEKQEYTGEEELEGIEVLEDEEKKEKREYTGEEELMDIEVLEDENIKKEDNDNDEK